MPLYRKRAIVVDAHQWDGNWEDLLDWAWLGIPQAGQRSTLELRVANGVVYVRTVQGLEVQAEQGEWLIREQSRPDRFYPCDAATFAATYDQEGQPAAHDNAHALLLGELVAAYRASTEEGAWAASTFQWSRMTNEWEQPWKDLLDRAQALMGGQTAPAEGSAL
jgi:hypothetical protein